MNSPVLGDDNRNPAFNRTTPYNWLSLVCIFVAMIASFAVVQPCFSQDSIETAREALSDRKYPWYDTESDGVKRIEFQPRPDARSANRNEIPLAPQTTTTRKKRNTNWDGFFDGLMYVVWGLAVLGIVLIIWLLVWAFFRMESNQDLDDENGESGRTMEESIKQLPFDLEAANGDFRSLAQGAYSNGDYRKAIIFLFSHVLVSLDQKRLIRLRKGKTNRQYLRELRPHRELSNYYQRVMVPFEATFFGEHELGQLEFESCWNHLEGFQSDIQQTKQVANE